MSKNIVVDVAVIGAGIAACHLAQRLAQHGAKVLLVDKRAAPLAGPTWVNAVATWMFDEAKLERPFGKEIFDVNDRFILRSPDKTARIEVDNLDVIDVHMGHLGKRLRNSFFSHTHARFLQCSIRYCRFKSDRLIEVVGEAFDRSTIVIKAEMFVDASGMKGIIRKCHPRASTIWPPTMRADSCTAAQRTLEIKDRHGAIKFLDEEHLKPGDILSDVGFMGGYSLFRVQVDPNLNHISLLCGIRALPQYKNAATILTDFVAKHPWIGKAFIDGRGVIPLNAPYRKFTAPGLALLGDSACQVYAAHGSGIGMGLIAATILADAISDRAANQEQSLANYQRQFHRRYLRRLYFSEHFRRFSQSLTPHETTKLISSGILGKKLVRQTLMQEDPSLTLADIKHMMHGATLAPRLFFSMMPTMGRGLVGIALSRRWERASR